MGLGTTRCDVTAEGASERLADFSIFNMADNLYTYILSDLGKVLRVISSAEFKNFRAEIKVKIRDFKWKVPAYSKFTVDFYKKCGLLGSQARDHFFLNQGQLSEIC